MQPMFIKEAVIWEEGLAKKKLKKAQQTHHQQERGIKKLTIIQA